jgi:CSLREA domain-containing protein
VMMLGLLLGAKPAYAKTFTVNSTSDSDDGECDPFGVFTDCTLREAINVARVNGNRPVVDTINFNIPGSGVKTISLTSGLPDIIEPVTINGYSQPGAEVNTVTTSTNAELKIVLDGSGAGLVNGLVSGWCRAHGRPSWSPGVSRPGPAAQGTQLRVRTLRLNWLWEHNVGKYCRRCLPAKRKKSISLRQRGHWAAEKPA